MLFADAYLNGDEFFYEAKQFSELAKVNTSYLTIEVCSIVTVHFYLIYPHTQSCISHSNTDHWNVCYFYCLYCPWHVNTQSSFFLSYWQWLLKCVVPLLSIFSLICYIFFISILTTKGYSVTGNILLDLSIQSKTTRWPLR